MNNNIGLNRTLTIFAIIVPVAIFLGWMMADPLTFSGLAAVGVLLGVISIPVLLKWHRFLLVAAWNTSITLFILPGNPPLWMLLSGLSLLIIVLESVLEKRIQLQNVRSLTWSLLAFAAVVFVTAYVRGGIGSRFLGSETYGGKKYFFIIGGLLGYFALSSRPLDSAKIRKWSAFFFLGTLTCAVSDLIYMAGPVFYPLFAIFPPDYALPQAMADLDFTGITRLVGISFGSIGVYYYVISRWGVAGIFDWHRPYRFALFLGIIGVSMLGGFRGILVTFAGVFAIQFLFERLFNTRVFYVMVAAAIIGGAALMPFTEKLPKAIQRAVAFLPVDVNPEVRADAQGSIEWRLQMWKLLIPEIDEYLWIGKGYVINPTDMYMAQESMRRGFMESYESNLISGDYHSGPLSGLINFGLAGLLSFTIFGILAMRCLYRNFCHGDPGLRKLNLLLFSCFTTKFISFLVIFGDVGTDLPAFAGLAGFSVAINGGMRERVRALKTRAVPAGGISAAPMPAGGAMQPALARSPSQG